MLQLLVRPILVGPSFHDGSWLVCACVCFKIEGVGPNKIESVAVVVSRTRRLMPEEGIAAPSRLLGSVDVMVQSPSSYGKSGLRKCRTRPGRTTRAARRERARCRNSRACLRFCR